MGGLWAQRGILPGGKGLYTRPSLAEAPAASVAPTREPRGAGKDEKSDRAMRRWEWRGIVLDKQRMGERGDRVK